MNMKRLPLMVFALLLAVCQFAGAGEKIQLIMGDVLAEEHPHSRSYYYFADRVKELTNGEVEVQVFVNSALGNQRDLVEGLNLGTVHIAKTMTTGLSSYFPEIQVFDLPYMFSGREHFYRVLDGEVGKLFLKTFLPQHGFYGLAYLDAGIRSIYNRNKPILKFEDVRGMKLRVPESPIFMDSMAAFNASGTPMPVGDIYTALQTGVIDGAENAPIFYQMQAHYEAAPYFSRTFHMMTPDIVLMSMDYFNSLSDSHQKALLQAADDMVKWERKAWVDLEESTEKLLVEEGAKFNDVDLADFRDAAKKVWAKYAPIVGQDLIDKIQAQAK
ncbi:MAG: TRAP transporter substrate-binding protein, partial [Planctomycetota bacterium]|jgi:tripartite ATP-independent transporter DctP family solute receptor|nr:TRAP transporter substrate-binding protein [Planctomycetota bacterium]